MVAVGKNESLCNYIFVNTTYGDQKMQLRYAHIMDGSILVSNNQNVDAGQVIGKMGNTGYVKGGYLVQLEILKSADGNDCKICQRINSVRIDPLTYFEVMYSNDEYLSNTFAVSLTPETLNPNAVVALAYWWEDENDPNIRYRDNIDLNSDLGEVYLRKEVEKYAYEIAKVKKADIETSGILSYNSIDKTVTVKLNGRTKIFSYNGSSVVNKNNRMVVRAEEFYSYFFIYPSYYNNPSNGAIVVLTHGYAGSVDAFKKTVSNMSDDNFINFGTVIIKGYGQSFETTRENIDPILTRLGISTTLDGGEIIRALVDKGKYVLIRTQLSDNKASHSDQIVDLQRIIKVTLPEDRPLILVGHSKGGLVSLGVASDKGTYGLSVQNRVLKTITLDTPYLKNDGIAFLNLLGYGYNDPAAMDLAGYTRARENLRDQWNQWDQNGVAYAIGVSAYDSSLMDGDYVVDIDSQLGGDFKRINKRLFQPFKHYSYFSYFPTNYRHTETPNRIEISREIKRICIGITTEFKQ